MLVKLRDLKNGLFPMQLSSEAAIAWYGRVSRNNLCLAENRLMAGEVPAGVTIIEEKKE